MSIMIDVHHQKNKHGLVGNGCLNKLAAKSRRHYNLILNNPVASQNSMPQAPLIEERALARGYVVIHTHVSFVS